MPADGQKSGTKSAESRTSPTALENLRINNAITSRQPKDPNIVNRALQTAKVRIPDEKGPEREKVIKDLALANVIGGSGISMLGRMPTYANEAGDIGCSYFHLAKPHWDKLTSEEQQMANMHFLDTRAKKGDVFQTSSSREEIARNPGTQLSKEIKHLIENQHYHWSANGYQLEPPK